MDDDAVGGELVCKVEVWVEELAGGGGGSAVVGVVKEGG